MALRGIKVIELAGLAPVPFCGMVLADFGATVIRIDKPGGNSNLDVLRNGKKSVALNLKHPDGAKIFRKLCRECDVLVEPYRPGVMEKLNLGPKILMKDNPRLIYARLTGFGQTGEYAPRAGHDINYVGLTGLLSMFSRKGGKPTPPANLAADFGGGGLSCAFGIVLALFERVKSNRGQIIDANMVQGTSYLGSWLYRSQNLPIWGNPVGENILDTGAHFYETYETKDGKFMAVGALEPQFYKVLIEKLEIDFEQFGDLELKKEALANLFLKKTQKEWCDIFDTVDACVTPVLSLEQASANSNVFNVNEDNLLCPKPAPILSRTPGVSQALEEALENGVDTWEVLESLGYTRVEIKTFGETGVVGLIHKSNL